MAEYKKEDLKSKIETDLADNDKGSITDKTIRNSMLHIVNLFLGKTPHTKKMEELIFIRLVPGLPLEA